MSDAKEHGISTPLPAWYWLFMPAGAVLIMLVTRGLSERVGASAWMIGIAALAGYVLLSGIVWRMGDWLRLAAMPTVFLSRGFLDTLRLRVFWAIGPQVVGLLILAATGCFAVVQWGKSAVQRNAGAASESAPAPTAAYVPLPSAARLDTPKPTDAKTARSECARPDVLALVRDEIHGALIMQIRMTHHVDLDMAQIRRMARIDLGNVRQVQEAPYFIDCLASFDQHADSTAAAYGLTAEHDPELTYWIQRDASGNLQVGVGD